ncbi:MAG TPA: hypothetical protein PLD05_13085, partial [Thermogutta sp.]|nr:hypothetical protein [Thermogutta sp.]HPU05934.1 hypothetical protein [Thermogutta sp.]
MMKRRLTMALLGWSWMCWIGLVSAQVYPTAAFDKGVGGCAACGDVGCGGCTSCGGWLSDFLYCDPCRPKDPW